MSKASRALLSAGMLLYRLRSSRVEVLLAHPGGPWWKNRDVGAWTIPKGLVESGEDILTAACREFQEETGIVPHGPFHSLGSVRQKAGKTVYAWSWEGDADADRIVSNLVRVQNSRGPGRHAAFPEIDRCAWFSVEEARAKLNPAQVALIDRLQAIIAPHEAMSVKVDRVAREST
jgi:predicted NUDIX family NTP pyrophosphohydrolase